MDNEIGNLLDAARDRQGDDPPPAGEPAAMSPLNGDGTRTVDPGDGGQRLSNLSFERAWRVRGEAWRRCASGRAVMLEHGL